MDKKVLKEVLNFMVGGRKDLFKKFSKQVDNKNFLQENDEIFINNSFILKTAKFKVLKDLTEKMKKVNKNFAYAFEILSITEEYQSTNFGFIMKAYENTYVMFYAINLEEFINLYHQKESDLNFVEIKLRKDSKDNIVIYNNEVISLNEIERFKSKFYYDIFKNKYLDHYINENNLKIRKLVTNIFD